MSLITSWVEMTLPVVFEDIIFDNNVFKDRVFEDIVFTQRTSGWCKHYFGELAKCAKFILSARLHSTAVFITVKYGYNKKIPDFPVC
jgi:hypothetical protein